MISDGYSFKNPEQTIKILLQCSLFHLTDKSNALQFMEKSQQKLSSNEQITKEQFVELTGRMWEILKAFLQSPKDDKSFGQFVKKITQISKDPPVSNEFAQNLLENLQSERGLLESKFYDKTTTRIAIADISYRLDISMMEDENSTVSSGAAKPIIILDILLSTGKRITFRVPYPLFHKLRFVTAHLLKEIQFLETRQIVTR